MEFDISLEALSRNPVAADVSPLQLESAIGNPPRYLGGYGREARAVSDSAAVAVGRLDLESAKGGAD